MNLLEKVSIGLAFITAIIRVTGTDAGTNASPSFALPSPDSGDTYNTLVDVQFPASPQTIADLFVDGLFTDYVLKHARDLDVTRGEWREGTDGRTERTLQFKHPVKTRFPGLPSHAPTSKYQALQKKVNSILIREQTKVSGIPYCDYFTVNSLWNVTSSLPNANPNPNDENIVEIDANSIVNEDVDAIVSRLSISLWVSFSKSTMMRGRIERDTQTENGEAFNEWVKLAREWITQLEGTYSDDSSSEMEEEEEPSISDSDSQSSTHSTTSTSSSWTQWAKGLIWSSQADESTDTESESESEHEKEKEDVPEWHPPMIITGQSLRYGESLSNCPPKHILKKGYKHACVPHYLTILASGVMVIRKGHLETMSESDPIVWQTKVKKRKIAWLLRLLHIGGRMPKPESLQLRLRDTGVLEIVSGRRTIWRTKEPFSASAESSYGSYKAILTHTGELEILKGDDVVWKI